MSRTFADLFRSLVAPRLREMCRTHGVLIACGQTTFTGAHSEIMGEALRLGAGYLPRDLFQKFDDKISEWILESVAEAQPQADQARIKADQVAGEYEKHERKWVH